MVEGWRNKRRKDRITEEIKQKVHEFFLSAEISRENPGKRYVMEVDGCKVQRHTMTLTLRDAFAAFKDKYPEEKLGFTSFSKAKPIQVCKVSETSRRTCLCMTCCNAALKAEALQKIAKVQGLKLNTQKEEQT